MFCSSCGKKMIEGSVFCAYCGAKGSVTVKTAAPKSAAEPNAAPPKAPASPEATQASPNKPVEVNPALHNASPASTDDGSSGWVSFLRFICWVQVIGMAILGNTIGATIGWGDDEAKVIGLIIGAIIGLMVVSVCMVFLNMAEDIRAIRRKIRP